jgi:hypothetical protein
MVYYIAAMHSGLIVESIKNGLYGLLGIINLIQLIMYSLNDISIAIVNCHYINWHYLIMHFSIVSYQLLISFYLSLVLCISPFINWQFNCNSISAIGRPFN